MRAPLYEAAGGRRLRLRLGLRELEFPTENFGACGLCFGFGNHALVLVEDGEACVCQNVVGIFRGELLRGGDGFVELTCVLQGANEAVTCVEKCPIQRDSFTETSGCDAEIAIGERVDSTVVMILGDFSCCGFCHSHVCIS